MIEKPHLRTLGVQLNLHAYMRAFTDASRIISRENRDTLKRVRGKQRMIAADNSTAFDEQTIILEGSVSYGASDRYRNVYHLTPTAKLIYMLRDPVERVFSAYRFGFQLGFRSDEQTPGGFHNLVVKSLAHDKNAKKINDNLFRVCRYIEHMEGAIHLFGRENVQIVQFEEFVIDSVGYIRKEILPFLNLKDYKKKILRQLKSKKSVQNSSRLKYQMLNETRILLQDYYRPYNLKLSRLLSDNKWTWGY